MSDNMDSLYNLAKEFLSKADGRYSDTDPSLPEDELITRVFVDFGKVLLKKVNSDLDSIPVPVGQKDYSKGYIVCLKRARKVIRKFINQ